MSKNIIGKSFNNQSSINVDTITINNVEYSTTINTLQTQYNTISGFILPSIYSTLNFQQSQLNTISSFLIPTINNSLVNQSLYSTSLSSRIYTINISSNSNYKLCFRYNIPDATQTTNSLLSNTTKLYYKYFINNIEQTSQQDLINGRGALLSGLPVFQAPVSGLYQFNVLFRVGDSGSFLCSVGFLHINNSNAQTYIADSFLASSPGNQRNTTIALSYYLLAGEQIGFVKITPQNSNYITGGNISFFSGHLVYNL
jgi:hypothetical protein